MDYKIEKLKSELETETNQEAKIEKAIKLSDLLVDKSRFKETLVLTKKYLPEAKRLNNLKFETTLLRLQANSSFYLGEIEQSIETNLKLVNLYYSIDAKAEIAGTFNNIAGIYYSKNEPNKSLEYLNKGIDLLKNEDDKDPLIAIYTNMTNLLINFKRYDEAVIAIKKAIELAKTIDKESYYITIYNNLAEIHYNKGDLEECFKTLDKAIEIAEKYDEIYKVAVVKRSMSHFLHLTGDTKKAIEVLLPMLEVCKNHEYELLYPKLLESLVDFFAHEKDFINALKYLKMKHNFNQQLSERRITEKAEELEAEFDSLITEKEKDFYKVKNLNLQNDITKLNEAYIDLESTQKEKILTEKLNTIIATAVTANHQINQPLMIIQGNLDLIYEKISEKNTIENYFDEICKNIKIIHQTLGNMEILKPE